jgi:DNA-binding transcriptional regulator YiaG
MFPCPKCGSTRQISREKIERVELDPLSIDVVQPQTLCAQCGLMLAAPLPEDVDLACARLLADLGNATGGAFRFLRRSLRFKATDVATLLRVRPETISRWENSDRQVDRAAWLALAAIVDDRIQDRRTTEDRIRATDHPTLPTKPVRIVAGVAKPDGRRTGMPVVKAVSRPSKRRSGEAVRPRRRSRAVHPERSRGVRDGQFEQ